MKEEKAEQRENEAYKNCVENNLGVMNEAQATTMVRSIPNTDLLKSYILPQNKAIQAVIDKGKALLAKQKKLEEGNMGSK